MYTGALPTISNRADWKILIQLVDSETDENIDCTGCTVSFAIRNSKTRRPEIEGSTEDEKVTFPEIGVAQIWLTVDDVRNIAVGSYEAGITITGDASEDPAPQTVQLFIGTVAVIDGVVR